MFEEILRLKNHNKHYLERYIKLIKVWATQTYNEEYTENHHICPKAKDLFPEYSSFRKYPWNKVNLTLRQHYLAHWLLWKSYGKSQTHAFWRMNWQSRNKPDIKPISSKIFEIIKKEKSLLQSALMKEMHSNPIFHEKARQATIITNEKRKGEQSQLMKNLWKNTPFRQRQKEYFKSSKEERSLIVSKRNKKLWKTRDKEKQVKVMAESRKKSTLTCPHCNKIGQNIYGNMTKHILKCKKIT